MTREEFIKQMDGQAKLVRTEYGFTQDVMADIIDKEWYQLLRELVWTIVVRAVSNNCRHAVCVMKGTNKVV